MTAARHAALDAAQTSCHPTRWLLNDPEVPEAASTLSDLMKISEMAN
jgi:hypothetical protein